MLAIFADTIGPMFLNLSELSSDSFTDQIIKQIRAKVVSGRLAPGSSLPSVRVLARETKISVMTVKNAYSALVNAGLIRSHQGKGYFVSALDSEEKRNLALQQCRTNLKPIIQTAIAENLSAKDIIQIVKELSKSQ